MTMRKRKKPTCWELIDRLLVLDPPPANILLFGLYGSGKTRAALTIGVPPDRPAIALNMTEDTGAAEIRGHYGLKDGNFTFLAGPLLRGWYDGVRVVVNEIEKCGPDALAAMLGFADDREVACQTLPDGTTVRPKPGFHMVATSNAPPEALEPALRDRFPITVRVDEVHPGAVAALRNERLRTLVMNSASVDDSERRVPNRQARAFEDLLPHLDEEWAAWAIFRDRTPDVLAALRIAAESF